MTLKHLIPLAALLLATPAAAHDTSYALESGEANAQAASDAGQGGYYAILPDTAVDGLNQGRMVVFFKETDQLPSKGVLVDAELKAQCEALAPFVASLPSTSGVDPADRFFGVGVFRNRDDGSNKSDRALLAVWRAGDGCVMD